MIAMLTNLWSEWHQPVLLGAVALTVAWIARLSWLRSTRRNAGIREVLDELGVAAVLLHREATSLRRRDHFLVIGGTPEALGLHRTHRNEVDPDETKRFVHDVTSKMQVPESGPVSRWSVTERPLENGYDVVVIRNLSALREDLKKVGS